MRGIRFLVILDDDVFAVNVVVADDSSDEFEAIV